MESEGKILDQLSCGVSVTTNNKMEMVAVLKALERAPRGADIEIVSDSTYVVKGMTIWLPRWKEKGWRAGGKPIRNCDLWQLLDQAVILRRPSKVSFRWVRGHTGHDFNELADKLAKEASLPYVLGA